MRIAAKIGLLFALCAAAFGQTPSFTSFPILTPNGVAIAGANVALCASQPTLVTPCGGSSLQATYTDITLGTACTLNPTVLGPTYGAGCTNPGLADGFGVVRLYTNITGTTPTGFLYYQAYNQGIVTTDVEPIMFPGGGSSGGGGLPNGAITFTNVLSVNLPTTYNTPNLVYTCWDNDSPANAIIPANVTLNLSTFTETYNFFALQSGFCVTNGSGNGTGGGNVNSGANNNFTGTNTFSGPTVVSKFNNIIYIDGNTYPTLASAVTACSSNPCTIVSSLSTAVSASVTLPSNVTLQEFQGGLLTIASGQTITCSGCTIVAPAVQIFAGSGNVTGLTFARPEWFGGTASANVSAAYNALISGGTLQLGVAAYQSPWVSLATEITKQNIWIKGSGQAAYNSQTAPTAFTAGTGTIIQGPVWVSSNQAGTLANGFHISDLSIDSGSTVCTTLFSGVGQQGLFINNNFPSGGTVGPPFIEGVVIENVSTLLQSSSAAFHSILIDNYDGAYVKNVTTMLGIYGLVLKGRRGAVDGVYGRGHGSYGLYYKSDLIFGEADDNTLTNARLTYLATPGDSGGFEVDAYGTNNLTGLAMSNLIANGTTIGLSIAGVTGSVNNVTVTNFDFENCTTVCLFIGGNGVGENTNRVQVSNGVIATAGSNGVTVNQYATDTGLFDLRIQNVGGDAVNASGINTVANSIHTLTSTGCGFNNAAGEALVTDLYSVSATGGTLCGSGFLSPYLVDPFITSPFLSGTMTGTAGNAVNVTGGTGSTFDFAVNNQAGLLTLFEVDNSGNVAIPHGTLAVNGTLTLTGSSAFAGQAACIGTSGAIGHCTSVVSSSGGCTCVVP